MKIQSTPLKPSQIRAFLIGVLKAGRVPFIQGSPGIGKSDLVHAVANHFDLKLIDLRLSQCDPTDLNGFPVMENGRSTYAPNKSFPLKGDDLPLKEDGTPYKGWLLFFDELPSAPRAVQAASYKILLDRMVGDHDLHPSVMLAAAGNKVDDGAIAEELGTALQSRLIHAEMVVDSDEWIDWAFRAGIHADVISFLKFKPSQLYQFKPDHTDKTFACPRTWHMVSDLLAHFDYTADPYLTRVTLSGAIGQGTASEFLAFKDLLGKLTTVEDIIKDPLNAPVPSENGHCFALVGAISSRIDATNIAALISYLDRMGVEYQVTALRAAIMRNPALMKEPSFRQKAITLAKYFQ